MMFSSIFPLHLDFLYNDKDDHHYYHCHTEEEKDQDQIRYNQNCLILLFSYNDQEDIILFYLLLNRFNNYIKYRKHCFDLYSFVQELFHIRLVVFHYPERFQPSFRTLLHQVDPSTYRYHIVHR